MKKLISILFVTVSLTFATQNIVVAELFTATW